MREDSIDRLIRATLSTEPVSPPRACTFASHEAAKIAGTLPSIGEVDGGIWLHCPICDSTLMWSTIKRGPYVERRAA